MKIYLFPNLSKTNCKQYTVSACKVLDKCGNKILMSKNYENVFGELSYIDFDDEDICIDKCDMIIAIGGDGTILKCSIKSSQFGKPILGINCGRLGFMASLEHTQLDLLSNLNTGNYTTSKRMMLKAMVTSLNGEKNEFIALNDVVVLKSDDCKIADYEIFKGDKMISSLRADGVIFSTATGATAYSMSAGGSIIEPEMECIELTHICPHSLFARSMILSAESVITVKCHVANNSHVSINVDGNNMLKLCNGDNVVISKSDHFVEIIDINGGSFFSSVNHKLMRPLKDSSEGLM